MENNKTGRYLKYAIGEIVLVVIGILIALSINNWNQNRIDRNEEKDIIAKLHKDFQENKMIIKGFIVTNKNEMNAQMELMNLIGASKEELIKHRLDSLFYVSFGANELAFADNTLKNIMQSGQLNLLKNEEINVLLYKWNVLSEIRKIRMDKLDDWVNDKFIPYLLSKISFKQMDVIDNLKWSGKSKVKPEYYPLFQEVEFENYLDNSLWFHQQILERCDETENLIDEIINATKPYSLEE
jgi:Family of unknown function (DUF6090)